MNEGPSILHTGPCGMLYVLDVTLPEAHLVPFQPRGNETRLGLAAFPVRPATCYLNENERERDREREVFNSKKMVVHPTAKQVKEEKEDKYERNFQQWLVS